MPISWLSRILNITNIFERNVDVGKTYEIPGLHAARDYDNISTKLLDRIENLTPIEHYYQPVNLYWHISGHMLAANSWLYESFHEFRKHYSMEFAALKLADRIRQEMDTKKIASSILLDLS